MRKISFLLAFLTLSFLSYSQNQSPAYFMDKISSASTGSRIDVNSRGDTILVSEYKTGNVKQNSQQSFERKYMGTPYFDNGWYKGKLVLKGGEPVEGMMAYNMVRGSVYFSQNAHSQAIELRPDEFTLHGHNFSKYLDEINGAGNYFYETLQSEAPMLLKNHSCSFIQTRSDVDNGYGSAKANEYEGEYRKLIKYYLVVDKNMFLVSKKKSFFKSLGKYSDVARSYVSKEKLNMKKGADILTLANYLGTIQ